MYKAWPAFADTNWFSDNAFKLKTISCFANFCSPDETEFIVRKFERWQINHEIKELFLDKLGKLDKEGLSALETIIHESIENENILDIALAIVEAKEMWPEIDLPTLSKNKDLVVKMVKSVGMIESTDPGLCDPIYEIYFFYLSQLEEATPKQREIIETRVRHIKNNLGDCLETTSVLYSLLLATFLAKEKRKVPENILKQIRDAGLEYEFKNLVIATQLNLSTKKPGEAEENAQNVQNVQNAQNVCQDLLGSGENATKNAICCEFWHIYNKQKRNACDIDFKQMLPAVVLVANER